LLSPGDILSQDGKLLGRHNGIIHYTIGQRRGIGIASAQPYYVQSVCAKTNSITVCQESGLYKCQAVLGDINLISVPHIKGVARLTAKHRYRCSEVEVSVEQTDSDQLIVTFAAPQKALTPGQALVLYNGDFVVGGGTIVSAS
jgi:tRNA-specific 2-thiouridylase